MQRLKTALEALDEIISSLEDKVNASHDKRQLEAKKQVELVKQARTREASAMALAQKVALRLDDTIGHVEHILRH